MEFFSHVTTAKTRFNVQSNFNYPACIFLLSTTFGISHRSEGGRRMLINFRIKIFFSPSLTADVTFFGKGL